MGMSDIKTVHCIKDRAFTNLDIIKINGSTEQ